MIQTLMKRDWFAEGFRNRLPVLLFLLAFQGLYFPINQFLSNRGGGIDVGSRLIDGNMPLIPVFVLAYAFGFAMMPVLPTIAALKFSRALFQEYMLAFFLIMVSGYSIWLLFPAYVTKAPIAGSGFFFELVQRLHQNDSTYGTYCAVPSSHVYYVTLGMCYYLRHYGRRIFVPFVIFAVLNALSTMFTRQHYLIDVITGWTLVWLIYELVRQEVLPRLRAMEGRWGLRQLGESELAH